MPTTLIITTSRARGVSDIASLLLSANHRLRFVTLDYLSGDDFTDVTLCVQIYDQNNLSTEKRLLLDDYRSQVRFVTPDDITSIA